MRTKESGEFIAREYLYYVSFHVVCFLCCTAPFYRELLLFCTVICMFIVDLLRAKFLMSCNIPLNSWMFIFYNFFMDERQLNENYERRKIQNKQQILWESYTGHGNSLRWHVCWMNNIIWSSYMGKSLAVRKIFARASRQRDDSLWDDEKRCFGVNVKTLDSKEPSQHTHDEHKADHIHRT